MREVMAMPAEEEEQVGSNSSSSNSLLFLHQLYHGVGAPCSPSPYKLTPFVVR